MTSLPITSRAGTFSCALLTGLMDLPVLSARSERSTEIMFVTSMSCPFQPYSPDPPYVSSQFRVAARKVVTTTVAAAMQSGLTKIRWFGCFRAAKKNKDQTTSGDHQNAANQNQSDRQSTRLNSSHLVISYA